MRMQLIGPTKYLLSLALVIFLFGVSIWFVSGNGKINRNSNLSIDADASVRAIEFELNGKSETRREIAIPHQATFGSNSFKFRGEIKFEGVRVPLSIDDFNPILLLRWRGDVFLLCQDHFEKAHFQYRCLRPDDKTWSIIPFSSLAIELRCIIIKDVLLNKHYREWVIGEMIRLSDDNGLLQVFMYWVKENPRVFYMPFDTGREQNDPGLEDFFYDYVAERREDVYYGPIETILAASTSGDSGTLINALCLTLIDLDRVNGEQRVCEFYCVVKQSNYPNETRLEAWSDSEGLMKLQCNCGQSSEYNDDNDNNNSKKSKVSG